MKSEEKQQLRNYEPAEKALKLFDKDDSDASEFVLQKLNHYLKERFWVSQAAFVRKAAEFADELQVLKKFDLPEDDFFKLGDSQISKLKSGDLVQINPNTYKVIVLYLDFHNLLFPKHFGDEIAENYPDPLFHSLINFMSVGDYTLTNMMNRAPGLYHAYRPASSFPGNIWVGVLEIYIDRATKALVAKEHYQSNGFDGRPNKTIEFFGYLVRKARHYTIISRNEAAASLSVALLPQVTVERDKIMTFGGAMLDMSTGRLWGGRVFFERVSEPPESAMSYNDYRQKLLNEATVKSMYSIPNSIRSYFANAPIPNTTMY